MIGMLIPLMAAAPQAMPSIPESTIIMREIRQGPMPAENIWLRPAHPGGADNGRMFPDIAVGAFRIDGDTLYVRVLNKGQTATPGPVLVAARAAEKGAKTDLIQQRTARLLPGEARWVPFRGFSVKTAATSPMIFALETASAVSAVARMIPSSTPVLDRSGQTREMGTDDADETNNSLTLAGSAIQHGQPPQ
jgi:hypothetical protein